MRQVRWNCRCNAGGYTPNVTNISPSAAPGRLLTRFRNRQRPRLSAVIATRTAVGPTSATVAAYQRQSGPTPRRPPHHPDQRHHHGKAHRSAPPTRPSGPRLPTAAGNMTLSTGRPLPHRNPSLRHRRPTTPITTRARRCLGTTAEFVPMFIKVETPETLHRAVTPIPAVSITSRA